MRAPWRSLRLFPLDLAAPALSVRQRPALRQADRRAEARSGRLPAPFAPRLRGLPVAMLVLLARTAWAWRVPADRRLYHAAAFTLRKARLRDIEQRGNSAHQ